MMRAETEILINIDKKCMGLRYNWADKLAGWSDRLDVERMKERNRRMS